ncbi:MAG: hypothetical protein DCO96_12880 [Fluviicola sp. XM-24bin1]|nr:MAG: hypothetical protein DCO96_12880 [Fluviicola sp. XM-24bin1]
MSQSENLDDVFTGEDGPKTKIPGATTALVCGIISIPLAGLIGIILGIVAVSSAGSSIRRYEENRHKYLESSYKNAKAGQVCGYIGLGVSVLWLIYIFARIG